MQSLKTVKGAIRDRNHRSACAKRSRKALLCLGRERVLKATTRVRTARRLPANITPKALVLVETSADSHTNDQIRNPVAMAAKGAKARKRTTRDIDAKKCGVITNPPHWARSCPEAVSAQVVSTSPPLSSASETAASDLPVSVNNSANSENVSTLSAILRDVLFPVGSFASGRAARWFVRNFFRCT